MASESGSVSISILGKEYQIACPPAEEEALRKSARYLDEQMSRIRQRGSTLGFEKIAVMAALNITHDLLRLQQASATTSGSLRDLRQLEDKIDVALQAQRSLGE